METLHTHGTRSMQYVLKSVRLSRFIRLRRSLDKRRPPTRICSKFVLVSSYLEIIAIYELTSQKSQIALSADNFSLRILSLLTITAILFDLGISDRSVRGQYLPRPWRLLS